MTSKKAQTNKVNLGDKVKDELTGMTGIATAVTEWLHGCRRILIQPQGLNKEGKPYGTYYADEPQVKVLKRQAVVPTGVTTAESAAVAAGKAPIRRAGGPQPKPSSGRAAPTRS